MQYLFHLLITLNSKISNPVSNHSSKYILRQTPQVRYRKSHPFSETFNKSPPNPASSSHRAPILITTESQNARLEPHPSLYNPPSRIKISVVSISKQPFHSRPPKILSPKTHRRNFAQGNKGDEMNIHAHEAAKRRNCS